MSQLESIKYHLLQFGSISPLEALKKYGCFRLGARIHQLRNFPYGMDIKTEIHKNGKHYAIYRLITPHAVLLVKGII